MRAERGKSCSQTLLHLVAVAAVEKVQLADGTALLERGGASVKRVPRRVAASARGEVPARG